MQQHSDEYLLKTLGERLARNRIDSGMTQAKLAREAGVSKRTVERIESGGSAQMVSMIRILRALNLLENLELLVPESKPSPMQQLESKQKLRQRAPRTTHKTNEPEAWQWGDDE